MVKIIYTIGFIFVLIIHLLLLGIIKILELIGKGFCLINDNVSDAGNYLSDKSKIDDTMINLKSRFKKWTSPKKY